MHKPLILIVNDDGIKANGLRALTEAAATLGEVKIVAPASARSGVSHAVTLRSTLHLEEVVLEGGYPAYSCSGTPVDSVKLALRRVLNRKPDILLSGINHGSNSSVNVIYSGTMAAAIEGALEGIPSIGFSLINTSEEADFSTAKDFVLTIAGKVIENSLPAGICLNVNIPDLPASQIKGIRICRQANAAWIEDFDTRIDPNGKEYHWMTGVFNNLDPGEDTDEWALAHHYISVVPVQYDLTAKQCIPQLQKMF